MTGEEILSMAFAIGAWLWDLFGTSHATNALLILIFIDLASFRGRWRGSEPFREFE